MLSALPTGWLVLVKSCQCVPCVALCRAWEQADANVLEPELDRLQMVVSDREVQLLRAVGSGLTNKEIGMQLHLHPLTIKNYLTLLFRKLGVVDRTQAALMAVELGLMTAHAWERTG